MKPLILKRIQEKPQRKIIPGNRDFNFRGIGFRIPIGIQLLKLNLLTHIAVSPT